MSVERLRNLPTEKAYQFDGGKDEFEAETG